MEQPSDSSIPMAYENEDWKQPLYPGAKVRKIDSFGQLEKQGTGNETGNGNGNRKLDHISYRARGLCYEHKCNGYLPS